MQDIERLHSRVGREAGGAEGARQRSTEELEMQPNGDAPLLRDDHARRKWVSQELSSCCEVRSLPPVWNMRRIPGFRAVCSFRGNRRHPGSKGDDANHLGQKTIFKAARR